MSNPECLSSLHVCHWVATKLGPARRGPGSGSSPTTPLDGFAGTSNMKRQRGTPHTHPFLSPELLTRSISAGRPAIDHPFARWRHSTPSLTAATDRPTVPVRPQNLRSLAPRRVSHVCKRDPTHLRERRSRASTRSPTFVRHRTCACRPSHRPGSTCWCTRPRPRRSLRRCRSCSSRRRHCRQIGRAHV